MSHYEKKKKNMFFIYKISYNNSINTQNIALLPRETIALGWLFLGNDMKWLREGRNSNFSYWYAWFRRARIQLRTVLESNSTGLGIFFDENVKCLNLCFSTYLLLKKVVRDFLSKVKSNKVLRAGHFVVSTISCHFVDTVCWNKPDVTFSIKLRSNKVPRASRLAVWTIPCHL